MKDKTVKTNVMRILEQKKLAYTPHFYDEGDDTPADTRSYGEAIAARLGQDPARAFKTLVTRGASGGYHVFDLPVAENLDLKKAAKSAGEKSLSLIPVGEILALTGYVRGGCSPVGMKKQFPTVFHQTVTDYATIFISGGKRGAQVELSPTALLTLLGAKTADIVVEEQA
ncbi:MAG: Cys-tRNA(Pro) deacylase [Oscillospiraceae bacterium]